MLVWIDYLVFRKYILVASPILNADYFLIGLKVVYFTFPTTSCIECCKVSTFHYPSEFVLQMEHLSMDLKLSLFTSDMC